MKIKQTLLIFALLVGIGGFLISPLVSAKAGDPCGTSTLKDGESCCGGVVTSIISCSQTGGKDTKDTGIWGILLLVINILTAGIGIAAVGGVLYGSILYSTAAGSPEQTKKAKVTILNVVVGLVAYALMYSFLNFIIPGGLFT